MATMYDAPMHDFSQDSTMDADMLPSAASESDWLQVETMMEDSDPQKPHPQEVDMGHDDVQEFEMGDADADFRGNFAQVSSEDSPRPEPLDQEIPDASRAPSPSAQAAILLQMSSFAGAVESEQESEQALQHSISDADLLSQEKQPTPNPSTAQNDNTEDEHPTHPADLSNEQNLPGDAGNPSIPDGQDNSTISGDSTRSPKLHPQQQQEEEEALEPSEDTDPPKDSINDQIERYEGLLDEDNVVPQIQNVETTTENQVTGADEDGLLMDPPPSVLLVYPFDNSHFAFFNLPETSHTSDVLADSTPEETSPAPIDQAGESKPEVSEAPLNPLGADHSDFNSPILLFRERFALYYEPLSLIFEALRADNDVNLDGRFDNNVELVISVPELDLTLPEDNIYSREVTLHDLGVLHNGCELSGSLSLRLDTVSPRFGTRYKAIRDEIVRVVSQQEEQEQSLLDPADGSTVGLPLHNSPEEDKTQEEVSLHQYTSGHEDPEVNADSESHNPDPQLNNVGRDPVMPNTREDEVPQDGAPSDDLASGEYVASNDYDDGYTEGQYAEENYTEEGEGLDTNYEDEDAFYDDVEEVEQRTDEHQSSRDEHHAAFLPDDPSALLDTADPAPNDFDEVTDVFDDGQQPATGESMLHPAHSPGDAALVDSFDAQESDTDAKSQEILQPSELQASSLDSTSLEFDPHDEIPPDDEPSLAEVRSSSESKTPRQRPDGKRKHDELIAYEDAVDDEEQPHPLPTSDEAAFSAAPTASKRSYDELDADGFDTADNPVDNFTESKRLRVD